MSLVLAHAGRWIVNTLYAAPMADIGGAVWWVSRRERKAGLDQEDDWQTDPPLSDTDPRA